MDETQAHHRKIELQAPADLTYLISKIKDAAQKKLDLHIPPQPPRAEGGREEEEEEDAFRSHVQRLVDEYITQTLNLALPSISINGLDASPQNHLLLQKHDQKNELPAAEEDDNETAYEAYDPRLAAHLRALHSTLESETTRVAELRREAPAKAAEAYVQRLKREMGEREAEVEMLRQGRGGSGKGEGVGGGEIKLERGEKVKESWEAGVKGLEGLRAVTEAVALLERARRAVGEVETSSA